MFHVCPVRRLTILDNELRIDTDDLSVGPGERMLPARIFITGIEEVHRNGEKIDAFSVEGDDAEKGELRDHGKRVLGLA